MLAWASALSFTAPLALIALAALPAIWLLLRVTPPAPRQVLFPPLDLFAHIAVRRETPARTPWWLLLLRLMVVACLVLAAAGPAWKPAGRDAAIGDAASPLALVIDNGAASAQDWPRRMAVAVQLLREAGEAGAPVTIVALAAAPGPLQPESAASAANRLGALAPAAWLPTRAPWAPHIAEWARRQGAAGQGTARIVWISDGVDGARAPVAPEKGGAPAPFAPDDGASFAAALARVPGAQLTVYGATPAAPVGVASVVNGADGLQVALVRPGGPAYAGIVRALDGRGLALGEAPFAFAAGAHESSALINLPVELRNKAARVDVAGARAALALALLDARNQRRRVGIVAGVTGDLAQPLLSPAWYVARALAPVADIREPRMGAGDAINTLIDENAAVIVLADVGALSPEVRARLETWMAAGGVLVRFAGPRLAASGDDLTPVRLRGGGRDLGGALSWDTPKTLAPFTRASPFFGLDASGEITVRRQLLAEPDGDLADRTWASLADGTPVVTAARRGQGALVLFHISADPSWSSLPMSGVFVQMLERILPMARAGGPADDEPAARAAAGVEAASLAPRRVLDGFGQWRDPPPEARGVARDFTGRASRIHPAGLYGPVNGALAVNVLDRGDRLAAMGALPAGARAQSLEAPQAQDLRGPLLLLAAVLFLLDGLATVLAGRGGLFRARRAGAAAALALVVFGGLALLAAPDVRAQGLLNAPPAPVDDLWRRPSMLAPQPGLPRPPHPRAAAPKEPRAASGGFSGRDLDAALETRLAYVLTGDAQVDAASKAGLEGLSSALALRTSLEPAAPAGVNPATDDLAVYPVLYWPVIAGAPTPDAAALRRLDSYMKGGGMVVFDTRDALTSRPGVTTPEGAQLRRILQAIDVPALEPAPKDHVLGKSFYLLSSFPGRYATGQTWVEALPEAGDGARPPARGGDGVTPIVITGNDWASAWAVDNHGEPLYPLVSDGQWSEDRQRELALRVGVNLVIHALTGNYKADQVHLPALLKRLSQ